MPRIYASPQIHRPNQAGAGSKSTGTAPNSNRSSNDSIKIGANDNQIDVSAAVASIESHHDTVSPKNESIKDLKNGKDTKSYSNNNLSRSRSTSPTRKAIQESNKQAANAQPKPVDRRSFMSDVKQEVMADDFCKLINRLEKLTYRLESSFQSSQQAHKAAPPSQHVPVLSAPEKESPAPVFELANKKWRVEHQKKNDDIAITQSNSKQTVHILACQECKVKIQDKVQSVLIESCTNVEVEIQNVNTTVEITNSKNIEVRLFDEVPTVNVEKVEGALIYLSKKSLDTVVVTSKSTGVNILVPNEDDDTKHTPELIAEQFKTIVNSKSRKLITTPSELFL